MPSPLAITEAKPKKSRSKAVASLLYTRALLTPEKEHCVKNVITYGY
jgi:hypothetical protein